MKIKYGLILLAAAMLLAGCAGFWNAPDVDHDDDDYFDHALERRLLCVEPDDEADCRCTPSPPARWSRFRAAPTIFRPRRLALPLRRAEGFSTSGTVSGIYLYSIGSGGALAIGNGGAVISSDIPAAMQVSGSWLIDTFSPATGSVQLDAIPINASTGAYTGLGPEPSQAFNVTNASAEQMVALSRRRPICLSRSAPVARSWFPSHPATRIRWVPRQP
jgi:hypothetical protein